MASDARSSATTDQLKLQPPPGWDSALLPVTFVNFFLFQCERISWGALERGPVFILWEGHQGFTVPDSCREDGLVHYVLGTEWFDDAGLVEQATAFDMPAFQGTFSLDRQDEPTHHVWEWRWSASGEAESFLTYYDEEPVLSSISTASYRFLWFNQTSVSYADFVMVREREDLGIAPPLVGSMASPMLFAETGLPAYTGVGEIHPSGSFSGTIHRFKDMLCEEPIES